MDQFKKLVRRRYLFAVVKHYSSALREIENKSVPSETSYQIARKALLATPEEVLKKYKRARNKSEHRKTREV